MFWRMTHLENNYNLSKLHGKIFTSTLEQNDEFYGLQYRKHKTEYYKVVITIIFAVA